MTGGTLLRETVLGQRALVLGASGFLVCHQIAETGVPVLIGVVIDRAVVPGSGGSLAAWIAALAVLFVCLSLAYRFGARLSVRAMLTAEHQLRLRLVRELLDPARGGGPDALPGTVLSLATSDAGRVAMLGSVIASGFAALAALLVAAGVLLATSLTLGLVVLLGLPPVLVALQLLAAPLERRSEREQAAVGHAAGMATDLISGLRVLKGLGAEAPALDRYRRASRSSLQATMRAAFSEAVYGGAAVAATGVFLAVVALVGGREAAEGRISIGELIAALGLSQFVIGPLSRLGGLGASLAQARASASRIASALTAPEARGAAAWPVVVAPADGELLGVAVADPADAAALVGALQEVGSVLVAPHDAALFTGTLRENVVGGSPAGDTLPRVLAATTVDEVAASLPDGAETQIGERGRTLSGGQHQRVTLARALVVDPAVLVLHDPTTAVDPLTEARIAAGIRELRAGRTTVLVTTSPALLAICDRVVLLDGDAPACEGTHAELVRERPRYREVVLT